MLRQPGIYERLEGLSSKLEEGIATAAQKASTTVRINRVASLLTVFFTSNEVCDYESASTADTKLFAAFFQSMLKEGIYWPPSQFEAAFVSLAHSDEDIQSTVMAVAKSRDFF